VRTRVQSWVTVLVLARCSSSSSGSSSSSRTSSSEDTSTVLGLTDVVPT